MAHATIVVFARRPRPGRVKTRLARVLGGRRAAALYAQLLQRTLDVVARTAGARCLIMPASAADCGYFRARHAGRGWLVRAQASGDLGRRMQQALRLATAHAGAAVIVGSDIADLTRADLAMALRALADGADVVLGPAADGGYWLIGVARPLEGLFESMRWGSAQVFATTVRRLEQRQLSWVELALRHDVDRARDLLLPAVRRALRRSA